jgi:hypothetical protein
MASGLLKDITGGEFRSSPAYTLILFDRLSRQEKEALADLKKDPELYGVLRPAQAGLGVKSVCRDTALLLFTLKEPGPLPEYARGMLGDRCNSTIAELVLDGVLEMRVGSELVSGAAAHPWIYGEQAKAREGAIERLSLSALEYAERLTIDDATSLSARMYFYNRLPASPRWRRLLPDEAAVAEHLQVHRHGQNRPLLDAHWDGVQPGPGNDAWRIFRLRGEDGAAPRRPLPYKLYISPKSEELGPVLRVTLELLTALKVPRFKFGRTVYGLLRPDKLIAYFPTLDQLNEAAQRLLQRLEGTPPHGVPFTSEVGGEGLLSWGMDPPRLEQVLSWQEQPSWRLWVTNRLAVALIAARAQGAGGAAPIQFALDRLRLDGVDPSSWTPLEMTWMPGGPPEAPPWK